MSPRLDDRARPPIRPGSDDDAAGETRERRRRREEGKGRRATNLGSLAAVVAAAAAAACLAPRGATAQFLSVPDTFLSSTDPSAPCPVDVDSLRLDPGLGEACDPGVQGDNHCDACVCDIALRLAEAGYRITGPDAVPFQACALQNLLALQQRGGLSIGGMMEVSRRCTSAPACIREISDDLFAPPAEHPSGAAAPASPIATTASPISSRGSGAGPCWQNQNSAAISDRSNSPCPARSTTDSRVTGPWRTDISTETPRPTLP